MPKRTDIESILIIGAGPIVIGQACEFDYSGAQACKALKEEGYRVILVNSNPATIMTDPGMADATYIEPITPEIVEKIIERERPDALLPTMGGQTALNTSLALDASGALKRLGVEMIGANSAVIAKAEDRLQFREAMSKIGLECPTSRIAHNIDEARGVLGEIGLPLIIRPSFTLGGTGGGIAYNSMEFERIVSNGIALSPSSQVLIEESVLGWKEYEMEVVRDNADNCIIICSIENVDPMGVHTGDSITVAPALTLTDKEYQIMRNASIAVLREIGVETGGSNVQFAVDPETGRMVVIEMNPRVSRSSALASKATGFPIAKIAAKLAVGYTLDELSNDITGVTPASFEPTIDYVVTKIPRFTFEKFPTADPTLTTSMKSVGEGMAIGRSFAESLQKGLRSMETDLTGLNEVLVGEPREAVLTAAASPRPDRVLVIAQAFRHGFSVDEVHRACRYDHWFLDQIKYLVDVEQEVRLRGLPGDAPGFQRLKVLGFSDARLAQLTGMTLHEVALRRRLLGPTPVYKRVDTCAAEFPSQTSYMYSTYEADPVNPAECEAAPSDRDKVVILGGGPNRIGQGIEFDYCCVHAAYALREAGFEAIMVNCNPETVSTDYDTSDRLYFEPLTDEDVTELIRVEQTRGNVLGVIVQFGGQTPLKLAEGLSKAGIPILGTPPDAIDLAEDRERFQVLLQKLGLRQPANGIARSREEAERVAAAIGFPVVIRPSYVLGGRAMEIIHDPEALRRYITQAVQVSGEKPVLLDSYLQDAIEVDVDAVSDGKDVYVAGVMQHVEEAGIHSGDSACSLPPHTLAPHLIDELEVADRRAREFSRRRRLDEHSVRHQGRRHLRARSESPRQPHRPLRRQGDRSSRRQDRRPDHGRRVAGVFRPARAPPSQPHVGEGGRVPVFPFPRRRHHSRPGDEIDRRGDGHRIHFQERLRQGADGRRLPPAHQGDRVHLGQGPRQGRRGRVGAAHDRPGLRPAGHGRDGKLAVRSRTDRPPDQQGAAGPPALRGRNHQRRGPTHHQHHRGRPGHQGQLFDPRRRLAPQCAALHHHHGRERGGWRPSNRLWKATP
jgi:carbamoyl-phosphate synthase large subunit